MPLLSRLSRALGINNELKRALYQSWYAPFMPIVEPQNYTNDLIRGYMDNDVIYSIINKIADTASSVPIELLNSDGDPIENHWLKELLEKPNEDTTTKELIFNYYVYLLSIGNSYIFAPKLDSGKVKELWTIPSDLVQIISGPFYEPISGYKLKEGNQEILFKKQLVMHGKLFNPRFQQGSWQYGLSPISVASEIIRALDAGEERMAVMAEVGGPPYLISAQVQEGLTPQQQELLEKTYRKKYQGAGNASEPMLSGTPLKVDKLGSNATDLALIESSRHGLRVLCNVYGVSSILFNDNESSTYNNVEQARKDFYQYTIQPLNKQFEQKLKQFLVPDEDIYIRFNYDNVEVLQDSILKKAEALRQTWELTPNEKREQLGYPAMDIPEMNEIIIPTGFQPIDQIGLISEEPPGMTAFLNSLNNGHKARKVRV